MSEAQSEIKRLSTRHFMYCWSIAGPNTTTWEVPEKDDNGKEIPEAERLKGFVNAFRKIAAQIDSSFANYDAKDIERRINKYEEEIRLSGATRSRKNKVKIPKYPARRASSAVRSLLNFAQIEEDLAERIDLSWLPAED